MIAVVEGIQTWRKSFLPTMGSLTVKQRVILCVCVGVPSVTCVCVLSRVWLFATPWTVARQALPMEFSRQAYWSELPFPTPGDLPDPEIEPVFPATPLRCRWVLYH